MYKRQVRKQVGPFFPIFVRISADELMEGGNTLEDTLEYLKYFEKEVDVLDVSCGLNGYIQYQIDANYLPDGWRSFMAKAVKEKYNNPCITVGTVSYTHLDVYKRQVSDIRKTQTQLSDLIPSRVIFLFVEKAV